MPRLACYAEDCSHYGRWLRPEALVLESALRLALQWQQTVTHHGLSWGAGYARANVIRDVRPVLDHVRWDAVRRPKAPHRLPACREGDCSHYDRWLRPEALVLESARRLALQ